MRDKLRSCWQNCGGLDDKKLLEDKEILAIDTIEDSIKPLDDNTVHIRRLITRFESCYHQADKEAEMIIPAIGSGKPPVESLEIKRFFSVKEKYNGRERSKTSKSGINRV